MHRNTFRFLYADRRMRRQAIQTGREIQFAAERWAVPGLLFIVFVLPFLANPSLLFQPAAWLWWVRGCAVFSAVLCLAVYTTAHGWHLPAQLTGATVDAMQQTGADGDKLIAFPREQPELLCALLPQQLAPRLMAAARQVFARVRQLSQQMWELPPPAATLFYPYRRTLPLPALVQEPAA
jgi:hypothetical protein